MDFTFSDEQLEYLDAVDTMLKGEVTPERIRSRWESDKGIDAALMTQIQELGLLGMLVPESLGGLGLTPVDFIQIAQACGRVALPEPLAETALVVAPLLVDVIDQGLGNGDIQAVLNGVISGEHSVAIGHPLNPCVNFAESADWLLLGDAEDLCLVPRSGVQLQPRKSVDPSRRLCEVSFEASEAHVLASGDTGASLWRATLNRGALTTAALLLGLAEGMVAQSVQYASDRQQFGRAIGANQALKHLMADVAVQIEYAKPVVNRAAYTLAVSPVRADFAVSHAKEAATRAALLASRNSIQLHGAMGYTWECNLHIWAKRAWALAREWGDEGFHKNRIHEWLVRPSALLGPEFTFGRRSILETASSA